jgi:ribokinase
VCEPATLAESATARSTLIVLSSLNLDLVAQTARLPHHGETVIGDSYREYPGGKGLNQAVAAARAGAQVHIVGCVGADAAGEHLRAVIRAESIDDRYLTISNELPTGRAMIWVDAEAENSIVVIPGANHSVTLPSALLADVCAAPTVLAQLEVPVGVVSELLIHAHRHGGLTILNPAPAADLSDELLQHCDVLVPNQGELVALGGRQKLHRCGVKVVIETRGSHGAMCSITGPEYPDNMSTWSMPAPKVTAVDTTGAGDVFCGYLAATLDAIRQAGQDPLSQTAITAATEYAAAAAAVAVTRQGAVPSVPMRSEVDQLLAPDRVHPQGR